MLKFMGKKIFKIYAENFCLSKPVVTAIRLATNCAVRSGQFGRKKSCFIQKKNMIGPLLSDFCQSLQCFAEPLKGPSNKELIS